jgi:hypothetical protein
MVGNAVYKGFPPCCTPKFTFIYPSSILHLSFTHLSPLSGEGSVKVPCPFVHAGTARKPLYTGTFSIGGEGEGYFLFLHIIVVIHVSQYRSFAVMGVPVCRKQNAD